MITFEKIARNKEIIASLKRKRENLDIQIKNLELKVENQLLAWTRAQSCTKQLLPGIPETNVEENESIEE